MSLPVFPSLLVSLVLNVDLRPKLTHLHSLHPQHRR
jgi:hypothetical protein